MLQPQHRKGFVHLQMGLVEEKLTKLSNCMAAKSKWYAPIDAERCERRLVHVVLAVKLFRKALTFEQYFTPKEKAAHRGFFCARQYDIDWNGATIVRMQQLFQKMTRRERAEIHNHPDAQLKDMFLMVEGLTHGPEEKQDHIVGILNNAKLAQDVLDELPSVQAFVADRKSLDSKTASGVDEAVSKFIDGVGAGSEGSLLQVDESNILLELLKSLFGVTVALLGVCSSCSGP